MWLVHPPVRTWLVVRWNSLCLGKLHLTAHCMQNKLSRPSSLIKDPSCHYAYLGIHHTLRCTDVFSRFLPHPIWHSPLLDVCDLLSLCELLATNYRLVAHSLVERVPNFSTSKLNSWEIGRNGNNRLVYFACFWVGIVHDRLHDRQLRGCM